MAMLAMLTRNREMKPRKIKSKSRQGVAVIVRGTSASAAAVNPSMLIFIPQRVHAQERTTERQNEKGAKKIKVYKRVILSQLKFYLSLLSFDTSTVLRAVENKT